MRNVRSRFRCDDFGARQSGAGRICYRTGNGHRLSLRPNTTVRYKKDSESRYKKEKDTCSHESVLRHPPSSLLPLGLQLNTSGPVDTCGGPGALRCSAVGITTKCWRMSRENCIQSCWPPSRHPMIPM